MRNNFLSDKELLGIYGINNPNKNLGNKYAQIKALQDIKLKNSSAHLIKNQYLRWTLCIAFVIIVALFAGWLFTEYSDGLLSWEKNLH